MRQGRMLLLLYTVLCLVVALGALAVGRDVASAWAGIAGALPVAGLLLWDTLNALRRGMAGVDIIALLAIIGALALRADMAAIVVALMVAGGGALEEYAAGRARRELSALLARTPRIAHLQTDDHITDIAAEAVRPGDLLLVKPGELVPVDGTIRGATAILDESALTGEPMPVSRPDGDALGSGVVNAGQPFTYQATATVEASTYAAIIRLVRATESEQAPMARLADRWAVWLLPATLLVAGGAWAVSGDPVRGLAVLVVATPCPLILATPIALICGVSRAAREGIIVKGGGVLERLARVRTVLFDKTGTLTGGTPRLGGVEALAGFGADEVLRAAASLDQLSQHAVAGAIVTAARAAGLKLSVPTQVEETPGLGLVGQVDGRLVRVGGTAFLEAAGLTVPEDGAAANLASVAAAAAWVAIDGTVAGVLLLADRIRPETPRALRALRAAGVGRLVMVSGDRPEFAAAVGSALGLDAVHAGLSPAGKITVLLAEKAHGVTLMVGDGINDAPALAAADVGLAMGARGAAAAAEAAGAVLLVDRLDRVADAITIASQTRRIALQSIIVGMGLSGIAMAVAAVGWLPPIAGALLQEVIDVTVILNALRALGGGPRRVPLPAQAQAARFLADHTHLQALLRRMRVAAEQMSAALPPDIAELAAISADLHAILLPHQKAEEAVMFPPLARSLGGRDPLGPLTRMHEEISHLCIRLGGLVARMQHEAGPAEWRETQRLLYVLEVLIALHFAAEEDLLAEVEVSHSLEAEAAAPAAQPSQPAGGGGGS